MSCPHASRIEGLRRSAHDPNVWVGVCGDCHCGLWIKRENGVRTVEPLTLWGEPMPLHGRVACR